MTRLKNVFLVVMMMLSAVAHGTVKAVIVDLSSLDSGPAQYSVRYIYFDDSGGNTGPGYGATVAVYHSIVTSYRDLVDEIDAEVVNDMVNNQGFTSFTAEDIVFSIIPKVHDREMRDIAGKLSAEIDGKSVGNTVVFTNNSGRDFITTNLSVVLTDVSGLGTAPIVNVGKTASSYSDISSTFGLAGLGGSLGKFTQVSISNGASVVADGESITVRVATAAILTTTYKFKVLVQGTYIN